MGENNQEIKSDKFLSFALGSESYGLDILTVVEIQRMRAITPIPGSPFYIQGVINLRGKIIPVIDLRLKLGVAEKDYDEKTCIIIINTEENATIGLIVDTVLEVARIKSNELLASPEFGTNVKTEYIQAFGRMADNTILTILNVDKILSEDDSSKIRDILPRNDAESIGIKE